MSSDIFDEADGILYQFDLENTAPTKIRLWDGNWHLVMEIEGEYSHNFSFKNNDAGNATIELPVDHPISDILGDTESWPTKSMYLTFDRNDSKVRWSGRIENYTVNTDYRGKHQIEITAVHDYQKLKQILVWANPFLMAEVQFPKAWLLFGPSRWAIASTLFVNLLRKNNSLWMVPDDPMNLAQWFDLDQSNWSMVVKPVDFFKDNSLPATVTSRFKFFHDCVKDIAADAQLSIEVRRYLNGDEPPWPGANLRHGCLVVDVVNKSGYEQSTAFAGDLITGLQHGIRRVSSDGLIEEVDWIKDPNFPPEYSQPWWSGSLPQAPWVTLVHGERSGISSTKMEYTPPGPAQVVTGGSSMPGVNEGMKAAVISLGGFIGSLFGQSQIGPAAEAVLEPLYTDVFAAFMAWKNHERIREQGWDYPFEEWADGADQAYTISAVSALRKTQHGSRERFSVEVEMDNGSPYWVGQDFFIGDRVAVHALGMPENRLIVEQVEELEYSASSDETEWKITIGKPEFTTGLDFLANKFEETTAGLKEVGVW